MQGVSYRVSAREAALRLGVAGTVRNLPNGDVEAVAQATPEAVEAFVAWCRRGPDEARVSSVQVVEAPVDPSLTGFQVVR